MLRGFGLRGSQRFSVGATRFLKLVALVAGAAAFEGALDGAFRHRQRIGAELDALVALDGAVETPALRCLYACLFCSGGMCVYPIGQRAGGRCVGAAARVTLDGLASKRRGGGWRSMETLHCPMGNSLIAFHHLNEY